MHLKRPLFSLLAFAALLMAALLLTAPQATSADSRESESAATFVSNVVDTVHEYHVDGPAHERAAFIAAAVDGAAGYIESREIDDARKETLVAFLRGRSFSSIRQLMHVLDRFSAEYSAIDFGELGDAAANGAIDLVDDPFTRLMTMEDIQKLQGQMQSNEDPSLGVVPMAAEDGTIEVGHLRWNHWGLNNGLKPHDEIIAINGVPIGEIEDMGAALSAATGETASITIRREGFEEPIVVSGRQGSTVHPSAVGATLPGGIAYIHTDMFSMDMHTEVARLIDQLNATGGINAVIVDLRNNPGGAMPACTGLADYFLPAEEVITTTKGRYENPLGGLAEMLGQGQGGTKIDDETTVYYAAEAERYEGMPLVLLVNGMSASASEMFSGAMRAHGRAELVGTQTYGKGVGQTVVPIGGITSMFGGGGNSRVLYMTVMTYFLPDGSAVQHIGVPPTIEVAEADPDAELFATIAELRESGVIDEYLDGLFELNRDFFTAQVAGVRGAIEDYPMISEIKEHPLAQPLSAETLAREIRHNVAVRLANESGSAVFYNLADDNQLQRAIVEACKAATIDPSGIPEYNGFGE